jgi:hypothetical protein
MLCNASGGEPVAIEGAHGRTYAPLAAQVGKTLRVQETATNESGSTTAESAATPVLKAAGEATAPAQPDTPEPVLVWPFRMASDESHIEYLEQDTAKEYEQCVALVLTTLPGEFPDEPGFGLPDPTFTKVALTDLAAVVRKWEPRAHTYFTLDELAGIATEVGVEVSA